MTITASRLAPGTYTEEWDGKNAQGQLIIGKGIYLFSVAAIQPAPQHHQHPDSDQDKSTYMSISVPEPDATLIDVTDNAAWFEIHYILTSANNLAASAGSVKVYNVDLDLVMTKALSAADLTPGEHRVRLSIPLSCDSARFDFLISPVDCHASYDKGHRNRLALQTCQDPTTRGFDNMDFHYDTGNVEMDGFDATQCALFSAMWQKAAGFAPGVLPLNQQPKRGYQTMGKPEEFFRALCEDLVVAFYGHARVSQGGSGFALLFEDTAKVMYIADFDTDATVNNFANWIIENPPYSQYPRISSLKWGTVHLGGAGRDNVGQLRLVVLAGCHTNHLSDTFDQVMVKEPHDVLGFRGTLWNIAWYKDPRTNQKLWGPKILEPWVNHFWWAINQYNLSLTQAAQRADENVWDLLSADFRKYIPKDWWGLKTRVFKKGGTMKLKNMLKRLPR